MAAPIEARYILTGLTLHASLCVAVSTPASRCSRWKALWYTRGRGAALRHVGILIGPNAHRRLWPQIETWMRERHPSGRTYADSGRNERARVSATGRHARSRLLAPACLIRIAALERDAERFQDDARREQRDADGG